MSFLRSNLSRSHVLFCLSIAALTGVGMGCNSMEIQREQVESRHVIEDLYERQLIENLVRFDHNRPFVHLEYTSILGTASNTRRLTGSIAREGTDSDLVPTSNSGVFQAIRSTLGLTGEGSQNSGLSFTAQPVSGVALYNAYVGFLNEIDDGDEPMRATRATTSPSPTTTPSDQPIPFWQAKENQRKHLKVSDEKPAKGTYCAITKYEGRYYYVPASSAERFFRLYAETTLVKRQVNGPRGIETLINQLEQFRLNQQF